MMKKGVTLIELLVVLAIFMIIAAVMPPIYTKIFSQGDFDATIDKFKSTVRKAQGYAMDSKSGAVWGVCVIGGGVRLYSSSCDAPVFKEDVVIPSTITLSGLTDITFNLRGEPSGVQSVTLTSSLKSIRIDINQGGGMTIIPL